MLTMKRFLSLALPLFLLMFSAFCLAQDVDIPDDLKDDRTLPREERIARHQKRVQLILEARQKAKEEEQKKKDEEARLARQQQQQQQPGQPGPQGVPPQAVPQEQASLAPAAMQISSTNILHFYPFDINTVVGQNFLTDMELFNPEMVGIEELRVKILFDPRYIQPIMFNDNEIHDLGKGNAKFEADLKNGEITYSKTFDTPQALEGKSLIRIAWQALKETEFTEITFDVSRENTALIVMGEDVLGAPSEKGDGIIPTGVIISPEQTSLQGSFQVDSAFDTMFSKRPPLEQSQNITLSLETEASVIQAGEIFDVSVILNNAEGAVFDKLSLYIRFDPRHIKVVDWDEKNWIKKGINIHDGFARRRYPFDYHIRNEADNYLGMITYSMGTSLVESFPSGMFAKIRFQALSPVEKTEVRFVQNPGSRLPATAVTSAGRDLLAPHHFLGEGLGNLNLQINMPR